MCHTITSHFVPSNHASVKRIMYFCESLCLYVYVIYGISHCLWHVLHGRIFLKILREPPSKRKIFYPALLIYPEGVFSAHPAPFMLLRLGTKLSAASIHDNSIKLTEIFVFFNWRIERGGLHWVSCYMQHIAANYCLYFPIVPTEYCVDMKRYYNENEICLHICIFV